MIVILMPFPTSYDGRRERKGSREESQILYAALAWAAPPNGKGKSHMRSAGVALAL